MDVIERLITSSYLLIESGSIFKNSDQRAIFGYLEKSNPIDDQPKVIVGLYMHAWTMLCNDLMDWNHLGTHNNTIILCHMWWPQIPNTAWLIRTDRFAVSSNQSCGFCNKFPTIRDQESNRWFIQWLSKKNYLDHSWNPRMKLPNQSTQWSNHPILNKHESHQHHRMSKLMASIGIESLCSNFMTSKWWWYMEWIEESEDAVRKRKGGLLLPRKGNPAL